AVMEEQGQFAEVRLDRWDPSGGEWRDPDEPAEHEDRPEPGRLQTTAIAFIKGAPVRPSRGVTSPRAGWRGRGRRATAGIRRGPWPGRRGGWCRTGRGRAGRG